MLCSNQALVSSSRKTVRLFLSRDIASLGRENSQRGRIGSYEDYSRLLLDKNPLEDINNTRTISGVSSGGKWFDNNDVKKLLEETKAVLGQ